MLTLRQILRSKKCKATLLSFIIVLLTAIGIRSGITQSSSHVYFPRGLRMDQAADPAAYLALCATIQGHPHCATVRPCIEIIEDEFLADGVRWQVVNTIALANEPDIRDGFRKVPHELAKLKKEFDKGKKNFRKHLIKDIEKYLAPNADLATALTNSVNRMTDDQLEQFLDAAIALPEDELLALLDAARQAVLDAVE